MTPLGATATEEYWLQHTWWSSSSLWEREQIVSLLTFGGVQSFRSSAMFRIVVDEHVVGHSQKISLHARGKRYDHLSKQNTRVLFIYSLNKSKYWVVLLPGISACHEDCRHSWDNFGCISGRIWERTWEKKEEKSWDGWSTDLTAELSHVIVTNGRKCTNSIASILLQTLIIPSSSSFFLTQHITHVTLTLTDVVPSLISLRLSTLLLLCLSNFCPFFFFAQFLHSTSTKRPKAIPRDVVLHFEQDLLFLFRKEENFVLFSAHCIPI